MNLMIPLSLVSILIAAFGQMAFGTTTKRYPALIQLTNPLRFDSAKLALSARFLTADHSKIAQIPLDPVHPHGSPATRLGAPVDQSFLLQSLQALREGQTQPVTHRVNFEGVRGELTTTASDREDILHAFLEPLLVTAGLSDARLKLLRENLDFVFPNARRGLEIHSSFDKFQPLVHFQDSTAQENVDWRWSERHLRRSASNSIHFIRIRESLMVNKLHQRSSELRLAHMEELLFTALTQLLKDSDLRFKVFMNKRGRYETTLVEQELLKVLAEDFAWLLTPTQFLDLRAGARRLVEALETKTWDGPRPDLARGLSEQLASRRGGCGPSLTI